LGVTSRVAVGTWIVVPSFDLRLSFSVTSVFSVVNCFADGEEFSLLPQDSSGGVILTVSS